MSYFTHACACATPTPALRRYGLAQCSTCSGELTTARLLDHIAALTEERDKLKAETQKRDEADNTWSVTITCECDNGLGLPHTRRDDCDPRSFNPS